ncbi:hypothetical protein CQW23_03520 [Capsicum baccatum]|uniref:Uncharacterized protein n=1 Tax=Capsicum baccatum TaxID=33114 RepID=A0A2G2XC11_CAPBA|nr:hypothetical protein CQW23_03520 [Capsicum baccatum]
MWEFYAANFAGDLFLGIYLRNYCDITWGNISAGILSLGKSAEQRPPKLPPIPLPSRCSTGKPLKPNAVGHQRPAINRHPHRLEPTVVQVLYYEQQRLCDVMDESHLVATESPALVPSKMNHPFSTDIRSVLDEVSSLKRENQEMKFELLKMKTKLKEIEKMN